MSKTIADLEKEYGALCVRAGQLQYEISRKTKDLAMINDSIANVNLEAAEIHAEEVRNAAANQEPKLSKETK